MRCISTALSLTILAGCIATGDQPVRPAPTEGLRMDNYSNTRVDFGIVVSDIEKAAEFYMKGLGLVEAEGFDVPADMGGDSGLTDARPFRVRVFKVADDENATQVKIMQFPDNPGKLVNNAFIHSSYGIRYLTFYVADVTAAVEQARAAGAVPLAKGPVPLPKDLGEGVWLAVVRDPDGNMIELVGPKKD